MSEQHTYGQTGDWLIGAAKRNPEALLVLAAGCALFLRGKSSHGQSASTRSYYDDEASRQPTGVAQGSLSRVADGASRLAEGAKEYASGVSERVSNSAAPYASAVSKFADDARHTVASQASRAQATVQQGFAQLLREQPLALAGLGLAAGATLAAIFPSTEAEGQAFGPAREALVSAASEVGDSMKTAAGEAGEQLKQAATDRGLNADSLKDLAREVAGTFTNKLVGKDEQRSPALVLQGAAPDRGGL